MVRVALLALVYAFAASSPCEAGFSLKRLWNRTVNLSHASWSQKVAEKVESAADKVGHAWSRGVTNAEWRRDAGRWWKHTRDHWAHGWREYWKSSEPDKPETSELFLPQSAFPIVGGRAFVDLPDAGSLALIQVSLVNWKVPRGATVVMVQPGCSEQVLEERTTEPHDRIEHVYSLIPRFGGKDFQGAWEFRIPGEYRSAMLIVRWRPDKTP